AWTEDGQGTFLLGTDDQGRDLLSAIMHGTRISLVVGFAAIIFAIVLGVGLGVLSGYLGGFFETIVMRAADVQLTIPGILVALMVNGAARAALPSYAVDDLAIYVLIFAIGISDWPQFARVTRGATLVEKSKESVAAAQVVGVHPPVILFRPLLPHAIGPALALPPVR